MPHGSNSSGDRDKYIAEGEAALFFLEALALKLIEKGILDADEIVQALEVALSAKRTEAEEGNSLRLSERAAAVLTQVANSMSAARNASLR